MALSYIDVLTVWQGLLNLLGMPTLSERSSRQPECLREFAMRFRCFPLVADPTTPEHMADFLDMVCFLTVLGSMTFTASMSGEGSVSKFTTWVYDVQAMMGPPEDWEKLKEKICRDPDHFRATVRISLEAIQSLKEECSTHVKDVYGLILRVEPLLGEIQKEIESLTG